MGYRSDVRIITSKKGFEKLKEFVGKYIEENKDEDIQNLLESFDINKSDGKQCYFGWNYVKWYENDLKDVDSIMNGLDYLEENGYSYRYTRIGEEHDDIEERSYDSEKEQIYLEYPMILRCFEDDYYENFKSINEVTIEENDKDDISYE